MVFRLRGMNPMKSRVLVVEDDVVSHRALAILLGRIGYDVTGVVSVRAALLKLSGSPLPQFIILDLMLPDASGVEVLAEVRRRKLPVKVAVITAAIDPKL